MCKVFRKEVRGITLCSQQDAVQEISKRTQEAVITEISDTRKLFPNLKRSD